MATFKTYNQDYLSQQGDNIQNIVFELMAHCIADGTRLIIEQGSTYGQKYIMVDFDTTDRLCCISSVDNGDEGDTFEEFNNYQDVHRWLSDFLRSNNYGTIYIETY